MEESRETIIIDSFPWKNFFNYCLLKTHISMFPHLSNRLISYRIFSRRQIAIFHTLSHTWSLLGAIFREILQSSAKASLAFHLNSIAIIVKVHFLFRNSGKLVAQSLWTLYLRNSSSRWPLSFPSFSVYYDGNYASEISVGEEHRFYRLSFRYPSSFRIPHISFQYYFFPAFRFVLVWRQIFHAKTLRHFHCKVRI